MIEIARHWRVLIGGVAAGVAGVVGFAGSTASADPVFPQPPVPAPATVTQTVTVAAVPQAGQITPQAGQVGAVPAAGTTPGIATAPAAAAPVVAAAAPSTIVPAASGTLTDFFKGKNVKLEPQVSQGFTALNIVLPMPPGWSQVPDPNVPDAFAVIADRTSSDLYTPNAQVVVYKLVGDFDPKEAISHGLIDSQQLPAWRSTDASLADFNGFPSAFIEGSYRSTSNQTLNTSRRHVIVSAGPDKYLVSLSVTASAGNQGAPTAAAATDAIVNGFKVGAATPAAPAPAAPGLPGLPPLPAVSQLLGMPG
jgi:hypothetical protein